jgi:PKD repeat protein
VKPLSFVTSAPTAAICLLLGAISAQAEVVLYAVETADRGVVISGGGSLNLDAWAPERQNTSATPSIAPETAGVIVGGAAGAGFGVDQVQSPSDYNGPPSFGGGTGMNAVQARGEDLPFGINGDPSDPSLLVPPGYVSGDPLVGQATYNGETFESLGMTEGTYEWTWGSDSTADSFTLIVGAESIGDLPPIADPRGPYTYPVDLLVGFEGGRSIDVDGEIVAYEWDFGDGQTGEGENTTHLYDETGTYNLTLTVTDDDGLVDSKVTRVTINEIDENPLLPDAGGEYFGNAGVPVQFNGTGSSPQDGTIESYEWDFGDGQPRGTGPTPSHTYNFRGQYIATLTVTTEDGASASDATDVSIGAGNLPPNADANGPYTGRVGESITFDGRRSRDPNDDTLTYEWDFGDGGSISGVSPIVRHTYGTDGPYNVILVVTDDAGDMDSDSTVAVIRPERDEPLRCSSAEPDLSRGNGGFIPVQIQGVIDPNGSPVTITIDSIFQDEPVGRQPDGRGVGTDTAFVRNESLPRGQGGNGRVYHIGFTATTREGGRCSGDVEVEVPLSRGGNAIDDGPVFDSTIPRW